MKLLPWLAVAGMTGAGLAMAGPGVAATARPASAAAPAPATRADGTSTVRVEVTGVRNAKGMVHVDICRQAEFLKDCPVSARVAAVAGKTVVTIANLAPGAYAAQVFHDENGNTKVDRALFGIPKEGVGFSNDAPIRFAPPKWAAAVFQVTGDKTITLKLRYFMGGGARN